MRLTKAKCDVCGAMMLATGKFRTDSDGFTGCLPCFPVSNFPADKDRMMRGPCYRPTPKGQPHADR